MYTVYIMNISSKPDKFLKARGSHTPISHQITTKCLGVHDAGANSLAVLPNRPGQLHLEHPKRTAVTLQ